MVGQGRRRERQLAPEPGLLDHVVADPAVRAEPAQRAPPPRGVEAGDGEIGVGEPPPAMEGAVQELGLDGERLVGEVREQAALARAVLTGVRR